MVHEFDASGHRHTLAALTSGARAVLSAEPAGADGSPRVSTDPAIAPQPLNIDWANGVPLVAPRGGREPSPAQ